MNASAAIADPLLRQTSSGRARLSDPHPTARVRIWSPGLRALVSRHGSATSRRTVMNNAGFRILKQSLFSPSKPQQLLHPPELSLPKQPVAQGRAVFHAVCSMHVTGISLFARNSRDLREKREESEISSS
jgi:hypothetical protein